MGRLSTEPTAESPLQGDSTLEGVAKAIKEGRCKNIIVMTGAGISVAAGIPDFRTPGTGLYSQLERFNLPQPEAVFEINFFRKNPNPFCLLAKELYPGNFTPTATHHFINLLDKKGVLVRNYTQNIDTLERLAGVRPDALVEAHGSFGTSHCVDCSKEYSQEFVKDIVFADKVPTCTECKGLVKPDIVFFGESLPKRYWNLQTEDFEKCDLLIVIGTSLAVCPFANLLDRAEAIPRLLINREAVGDFKRPVAGRDVVALGDCQKQVLKLAELLGWKEDLQKLIDDFKVPEAFDTHKKEPEAAAEAPVTAAEPTTEAPATAAEPTAPEATTPTPSEASAESASPATPAEKAEEVTPTASEPNPKNSEAETSIAPAAPQ